MAHTDDDPIGRRAVVRGLGAMALGGALVGCGEPTEPGIDAGAPPDAGTPPDVGVLPDGGPAACDPTPATGEGPFYLGARRARWDITEGRPGVPLRVVLRVIEPVVCTPVRDAEVDLWHADAEGLYSGYTGQGDSGRVDTRGATFMRGTQTTDGGGIVQFRTVYPGWYFRRTVHLHARVRVGGADRATLQIYFPDAVTDVVHERSPYAARGPRDTTNERDETLSETPNGERLFADVTEEGEGWAAFLDVVLSTT